MQGFKFFVADCGAAAAAAPDGSDHDPSIYTRSRSAKLCWRVVVQPEGVVEIVNVIRLVEGGESGPTFLSGFL